MTDFCRNLALYSNSRQFVMHPSSEEFPTKKIEGAEDGHVIEIRNLLFPGDGLGRMGGMSDTLFVKQKHKTYYLGNLRAAPEVAGAPVKTLYLEYLPQSNQGSTSIWEKIVPSQLRLLTMCYSLRMVELSKGPNSNEFAALRLEYKTKINSHETDFTKP